MSEYIYYFETEADFNQARSNHYSEPWVSYTEGKGVDYNKIEQPIDYNEMPLTFVIDYPDPTFVLDGNVTFHLIDGLSIKYSKNNGEWITFTSSSSNNNDLIIPVVRGDRVSFKGNNNTYVKFGDDYENGPEEYSCIKCTSVRYYVEGNIMSLIDESNYTTLKTLTEDQCLYGFFTGNETMYTAENLKLPATTLTYGCYQSMFNRCYIMEKAPELPAKTGDWDSYKYMFLYCNSLNYVKCLIENSSLACGG